MNLFSQNYAIPKTLKQDFVLILYRILNMIGNNKK